METKNLTHRLYINEYNEEFVRQLSNNKITGLYCTDESTNTVLSIVGTAEDLRKLAGLMYADIDEIKAAFPSFMTAADAEADCCEFVRNIYGQLGRGIARILSKYDHTSAMSSMKKEVYDAFMTISNFYIDNEINCK